MLRFPTVLALCLALAACARYAMVGPDTVGPGYVSGGGGWSTGGGITVAARAMERNGVTVLCGAWATDRQSALSAALNEDVIDAGGLMLGGQKAIRGLGFMPRARDLDHLAGAPAACAASSLPWRPEYGAEGPEIRLPTMDFMVSRDKPIFARFSPGPRPALFP